MFASADPLTGDAEAALVRAADDYLAQWKAHGVPLTVGRDWREHRFLTVGVDVGIEAASGCSIDGLFRVLRGLEREVGTSLVGSGRVYYRGADGAIVCTDRDGFAAAAERGEIGRDTPVFDLSVTTLAEWRERFENAAGRSWHGTLLPARSP